MPPSVSHVQRTRKPITVLLEPDEILTVDSAARLRRESRTGYARRVLLREANADLRADERKMAGVNDGEAA